MGKLLHKAVRVQKEEMEIIIDKIKPTNGRFKRSDFSIVRIPKGMEGREAIIEDRIEFLNPKSSSED